MTQLRTSRLMSQRREALSKGNLKHGHARAGKYTAEYRLLMNIIDRCCRPGSEQYERYGARGITICDEWRNSPAAFLAYVGKRPSAKYSLDRFPDNNGNYQPGNVRWANRKQQMRNMRNNRIVTLDGVTMCIADHADRLGVNYKVAWRRANKVGDNAGVYPARSQWASFLGGVA